MCSQCRYNARGLGRRAPFEHEASGLAGVQVEDLNANQRLGLLGTLAAVGNMGAVIITYTILGVPYYNYSRIMV